MWWILITLVLAAGVALISPSNSMAELAGTFVGATIIIGLVLYVIKSFLRK
jgi:hypothetical protein